MSEARCMSSTNGPNAKRCGSLAFFSPDSEEFGTFRLPFRTSVACLVTLLAVPQPYTMEVETTMAKQRTGAYRNAPNGRKAVVVKGGEAYRAEQGSDYLPGISAET